MFMEIWYQTKLMMIIGWLIHILPKVLSIFDNSTKCLCRLTSCNSTKLHWRATRSYHTVPLRSAVHCWQWLWILSTKVAGFCRFLCVYVCTHCLCVSSPLWSPLIPNLTDLLQRQPLMCAESLSGILDAVSIIFNSYSLLRNPLFCFHAGKHTHTYDASIVQQDRWLLCYESVYTFRCVFTSSLFCNFTSLSSFNPILILCKPSNLWP